MKGEDNQKNCFWKARFHGHIRLEMRKVSVIARRRLVFTTIHLRVVSLRLTTVCGRRNQSTHYFSYCIITQTTSRPPITIGGYSVIAGCALVCLVRWSIISEFIVLKMKSWPKTWWVIKRLIWSSFNKEILINGYTVSNRSKTQIVDHSKTLRKGLKWRDTPKQ